MFDTSKDILNLVIGFSVLWLALWFSWILYQVGRAMKNMNKTFEGVQQFVQSLNDGVAKFKNSANTTAAYLTVLLKSSQSFLQMIQKNKKSSSTKKKTTKEKRCIKKGIC